MSSGPEKCKERQNYSERVTNDKKTTFPKDATLICLSEWEDILLMNCIDSSCFIGNVT